MDKEKNVDISIIMPAYNTEKYIGEAIDSICKQKEPNVELIIINDGSTDNTEKVIEEKMKEYDNIRYFKQENSGLSYSRKVGLDHSRGKYIYFVDSDDYIYDNSLSEMFNYAEKNNLDCLMINARFQNELDNEYGYRMDKKNVVSKMDTTEITTGENLLLEMIKNREWRYAVWLYFIKKEELERVTFFKDFIHEDSAFNYELLNKLKRIQFVDKDVYVYRLRENSLMSTKTSIKNILGYINSYMIIYNTNNKKDLKYEPMLFEMRIFDQIIESYGLLGNDKELAKKEIIKLKPLLEKRHYYYVDKYRDFLLDLNDVKTDNTSKLNQLDYIDYLEVDIVDHCNLNCNDCTHYSPLAEPNFMDALSFEKDIKRLSELTNGKINSMVLMGGEPLLHKDINKFIRIVNKYLPDTRLQILSNGILIDKMSDDFWNTCKECNVQINITPYPINMDYYKVFNKILDNGLDMFIYDNGQTKDKKFDRIEYDYSKSQDLLSNYLECNMAKNCANLKNGRIYICPIVNNIDRYNNYYGTNLEVLENDYIDIYDINSGKEIYDFLAKPVPFCGYCDVKQKKKVLWKRFKEEE